MTWRSPHARRVVAMSSDAGTDWRRFGAAERLWYWAGMLSDLALHAAVAARLVLEARRVLEVSWHAP